MKKGFSLFELVVVIALLSIVMPAMATVIFISSQIIADAKTEAIDLEHAIVLRHIFQKNAERGVFDGLVCAQETLALGEIQKNCTFLEPVSGKHFSISIFKK